MNYYTVWYHTLVYTTIYSTPTVFNTFGKLGGKLKLLSWEWQDKNIVMIHFEVMLKGKTLCPGDAVHDGC